FPLDTDSHPHRDCDCGFRRHRARHYARRARRLARWRMGWRRLWRFRSWFSHLLGRTGWAQPRRLELWPRRLEFRWRMGWRRRLWRRWRFRRIWWRQFRWRRRQRKLVVAEFGTAPAEPDNLCAVCTAPTEPGKPSNFVTLTSDASW